MEVHVARPGQLPLDNRLAFNAYLEQWYNADGGEEPQFVRYHRWFGPSQGNFQASAQHTQRDVADISPTTMDAVNALIEAQLKRPLSASDFSEDIDAHTTLESLGLDSLDRMDVSLAVERQFGYSSPRVAERIGELWAIAEGKGSQIESTKTTLPDDWYRFPTQQSAPQVHGQSLGEAFLRCALANLNQPIVNDQLSGLLTHRRMLVAARLLAKQFSLLPEKHVGILLPASVAADIVFFALQLANKIPVMLNWTTGPHCITHALQQTMVKHVVTARRLMDQLGLELPETELLFMEELKLRIRRSEAAFELLRTYWFPAALSSNIWVRRRTRRPCFCSPRVLKTLPRQCR
ncbi:MAG: phosphopantetheine-binding protein [Pirellulaceae bacterium]